MKNKVRFGALLSMILFAFMVVGNVGAYQIDDVYYGADDHGYGDVIGSVANFGIDYMNVEINSGTKKLEVQIKTNYRGDDYDGFPNLTTEFGDLFISTDGWTADDSLANYLADNYLTGEDWEYAFDVTAGKLYQITAADILLSEHKMPESGYIYRNGQEVLIKDQAADTEIGTGTVNGWSNGFYSFDIDISEVFDSWITKDLGFHWTMTCGNDVIEGLMPSSGGGQPPVPEPATMLLLGSGLLGFAGLGRKKFSKK